ncbi:glyoxalase superfamily protein [Paenibacillus piri]|uniref:Bleomycin resistance protein n=1 Tax=Paenibacillus piri TaxID=2547395 RepID=A0A4R5KSL7_9BACL|nr:glyoxalase superfamily protein [Paenibacillus piri]TDF98791.1 VOC family protein [Paenibacillus piri]
MENNVNNFKSVTPILRIFEPELAKRFYIGYLEFQLDWEHRFEDDAPLYMQLSKDGCRLHLSEHHGDCCPGAAVRIEVADIEELHARLLAKPYKYARPGLELTPWQTKEIQVIDPFGNRIVLYAAAANHPA